MTNYHILFLCLTTLKISKLQPSINLNKTYRFLIVNYYFVVRNFARIIIIDYKLL